MWQDPARPSLLPESPGVLCCQPPIMLQTDMSTHVVLNVEETFSMWSLHPAAQWTLRVTLSSIAVATVLI